MSDIATAKDIKSAIKLVKGLRDEASSPDQRYHLELAKEALEGVETDYHFIRLNKRAQVAVGGLYTDTTGDDSRVWSYVLTLLENDRRKRGVR